MITHDQAYESLAKAPIKTTDVVVVKQISDPYGYYDDTPIWTSSDSLRSVKIDAVGFFLGAVTKKATVELLGIIDTAANGDVFQVRAGLYDNDLDSFNYISQGFYIVDNVEYKYDSGSTIITLYDHMWTAQNTPYASTVDTTGFVYPATVEEVAGYAASSIGVELMANFSELPNASYSVLEDPYYNISGSTIQTVIAEIAQATGTIARISDTTLVFAPYAVNPGVIA